MIYLPIKTLNTSENRTGWHEQKGREVCSYKCPETKNNEKTLRPIKDEHSKILKHIRNTQTRHKEVLQHGYY